MLTTGGEISVLGAAAAAALLLMLVGREMLVASGRRASRRQSGLLAVVLVSLAVLVGWVAVVRVVPTLEQGRAGPRLTPRAAPVDRQVVHHSTETFNLIRVNGMPQPGWHYIGAGTARVVTYPTSFDRSLELAVRAGDVAGACRSFAPVTHGTARMKAITQLHAQGGGGRIGLRAMTEDAILAEVVLTAEGTAQYTVGASTKTVRAVEPTQGKWFRMTLAVHLNTGRYDWAVESIGENGPSFSVTGADLDPAAVRATDQFCIRVEGETAAATLHVNDLNAPR